MALVSPGVQITVTDESQYISSAVGTVPLVVLATAQDKTANGSYCSGTSAANAGVLQVFGSQRDLIAALGYPTFQQTSAGTAINGDERNEYGLMAAYSALGLGNQIYAIRADVDLNQLVGTSIRPTGKVADGTYWFDLADTTWGIFEWSAATQSFTQQTPIIITSSANTTPVSYDSLLTNEPTPLSSIGQIGSYAVVATTTANRIFYKRYDNTWFPIGSTGWQNAWPAVTGSAVNPTLTSGQTIIINGTTITLSGTSVASMVTAINTAAIAGVTARAVNNQLYIYATKLSASNGSTADGKITITKGVSGTLVYDLGLMVSPTTTTTTLTLGNPVSGVVYGNYASVPQWNTTGLYTAPSGAVWLKTGTLGSGSNFVFQKYNALTDTWTTQAVTAYKGIGSAIYGIDPVAGGSNIGVGTVIVTQDPNFTSTSSFNMGGFRPRVRTVYGAVKAKAATAPTSAFTTANYFTLLATAPGTASYTTYTVTVNGTNASAFVSAILAQSIPYVTAAVESDGSISMTHLAGGNIILTPVAGQQDIPTIAGFVSGVTNVEVLGTSRVISGFTSLSYTYSLTEPYANPADGTLWYYSDATTIDIMINDGSKWRGYANLSADARGYNLTNTDPLGVIVSAGVAPTVQSDNSSLVAGDLWLDSSNLENYPSLYRYNGSSWISINKADAISQNGILFADARWDGSGTTDPVAGTLPAVSTMLSSDYTDLDAPNPLLYPRGMLLWNMRRSGYNVKRYVSQYFNYASYGLTLSTYNTSTTYAVGAHVVYGTTIYVAIAASTGVLPTSGTTYWSTLVPGSWVTASGLQNDGSMYAGHYAQRAMIAAAMKSAVDSNTQIREEQFQFNLIAAPGYPEVIANMVALNNDRANTAFVIGDTPMTLDSNVVNLTNWSNDTNGNGLATADPYLAVYWPHGLTNDVQGNTIVVPASHMALRTYLHNDSLAYPWFAPAGTRRGLVDNATDIGYVDATSGEFMRTGVSNNLRDSLYSLNINPVTIFPGIGIVVWGQKTRNPVSSSLDRVNVARLTNYIRTVLAKSGNGFLFEPNDKITRDQLKAIIESSLNDLVSKRGIYDYLVVCDTSNNTPDRIARNELYVDIAIEPMKDVEFVYIPIRLLNPGSIAGGSLGNNAK